MGFLDGVAKLFGNAETVKDQPGPGNDFWYNDMGAGGNNAAGITMTPDIALKSSAVFSVIKTLAETISTIPINMHLYKKDGSSELVPDNPLHDVLCYQANVRQTAVEFWETIILHAALRGNTYAEIIPGPRGAVDQLMPLHPDTVRPFLLADGTLKFEVRDQFSGRLKTLLQDEIFRIPGMSSDSITGIRAVDIASEAIGLGIAADAYASRVFSNKLNIGGFLIHPNKLSTEAQKNLIQSLMERFAGSKNAHRPVILQEGMTFAKATMDAKDAQLLDARKWQVAEIARYWRVPLHMLGIYDGATHSNVEQQAIDFVKYTLRPWLLRIEQAIRRDLITEKKKYFARFDVSELLRGDEKTRAEYYNSGISSGWLSRNEARVAEGKNKVAGLDEYLVPLNLGPASQLGMEPVQPKVGTKPGAGADQLRPPSRKIPKAERLVQKEHKAISKALMRFAGDDDSFASWVKAFYGGHVSSVMETLDIPRSAAVAYCEFQRNELLAAKDVPWLLQHRGEHLAALIDKTIKESAQG